MFYFGNLVGEAGNVTSPLSVGALDLASVKRSLNAASTIMIGAVTLAVVAAALLTKRSA